MSEVRENEERIIDVEYTEEMSKSYVDYAMSVIVARALPDIRDGLKPVQRRTLYDMNELGIHADKPYRKSARIVGDTMGKYHPHGDSSIYDAMVVMSQDFKKEVPLVDGHGNFGSIEGDGAAAMRYTEARLQKITDQAFFEDIEKDVVDFIPNFDNTEKEPVVLPARFPNFLVNGSEGIAVGMTTSTPSHNIGEIIDAEVDLLEHPKHETEDLLKYVQGPDWPTGGEVINKRDLSAIYNTGAGKIRVRGKIVLEQGKRKSDKDKLVIAEIPPTMVGNALTKFYADLNQLIQTRVLSEVSDVINASDKDGIRIILELKKGADVERIKNILYTKTKLEDTFGVNMLAIVNGRPETLSLKAALQNHIDFLFEVNKRKYKTMLEKETAKKEIQEGLIKAVDVIDLIIEILRGSKNVKDAKACLISGITDQITFRTKTSEKKAAKLNFTERQADAILEMRLQKLIGLEILSLQKEYETTLKNIEKFNEILNKNSVMVSTIKKELLNIKKLFAVERKTAIMDAKEGEKVKIEEPAQDVKILINRFGYVKAVDPAIYEKNKEILNEESTYILDGNTHGKICAFTNKGNMYQIKTSQISLVKAKDKGTPIVNYISFKSDVEEIVTILTTEMMVEKKLIFITKHGLVKKVDYKELQTANKTIAATKLEDEDSLIAVLTDDCDEIKITTNTAVMKKIKVKDIKELKKNSKGVMGFKMKKGDFVKEIFKEKSFQEIKGQE